MDDLDIRLLEREELPQEVFPGGRSEPFRVFFTPEVHAALWKHAGEDTSVEICGVLVGSWHRDEVGPFVKIVESIRGEGAQTRFAEVTFTHQTWAKINAEMDTKFTALKIVGWYHTHPDFGIFLSDRDRFIQEHFFSGPGQIAHVIDPIRKIEGVFVWRKNQPTLAEHFWIGDRIVTGLPAGPEPSGESAGNRRGSELASGGAARAGGSDPRGDPGDGLPPWGRLMIHGGVFLVGYLLATLYSGWERQRFVESTLASNGVASLLRLGLSDQLDRLQRDLAAVAGPLNAAQAKTPQADSAFGEIRAQLAGVARRIGDTKSQYGNTAAEDEYLRRFLLEKFAEAARAREPSAPQQAKETPPQPAAPTEAKTP
jgi:proteasome lid subunit RPN8/RPN11